MKKLIPVLFAVLLLVTMAVTVHAEENANVVKGNQVAVDAAKMTFPADATEHTAVCPVCGVSATWLPLTPEVLGAGFTAAEANTHYYLTGSAESAGAKFTMAGGNSCLHLNGKNITSTGGRAIEGTAGVLNIMGSGKIQGGGVVENGGSVYLNGATMNMYGGTIQNGVATVKGGNIYIATGAFNMYGGEITNGVSNGTTANNGRGDGGGNIYLTGQNSVMHMYNGTISGGKAKVCGGNIFVTEEAQFFMHDGTLTTGEANLSSTNYVCGGGNLFVGYKAKFDMYDGTISYGEANKGGNIGSFRWATLNITGGIIELGTAKVEGGNLFSNSTVETVSQRVAINLENVIIRNGSVTGTSSAYGGNMSLNRATATIGAGTLISEGTSGYRAGNIRLYLGTIVMTGGKITNGTDSSSGYDEIQLEGTSSAKSIMYMLGGEIEAKEVENASVRANAYSEFYLGGDATIVDNNPANYDFYIYKASSGTGKLFICDGWTGSATVSSNVTFTTGSAAPTDQIQVVTLDEDRNATVGGSFSGKLKNSTTGAMLVGNSDGTLAIGSLAVVDAAGKVTLTDDPLTLWATGNYAFIRLYKAFEIADPAAGMWVDLNGCSLTLSGSGNINVFDSANDTYRAAACGKVINNGTVTVNQDVTAPNGNRYLAVADGNTTTMHRIGLKLTAVTLRTTEAGVYYKAKYECDETLAAKVKRYGVVVSLADMPGEDFLTEWDENQYTTAKNAFKSGVIATSGSVFNIMKASITDPAENAARGEMDIYANPYICFNFGKDKIVVADTVNAGKTEETEGFNGIAMSLHNVLDTLDDTYFNYDAATQTKIDAFYKQWKQNGMADWVFINIASDVERFDNSDLKFAEDSNEAECPACGALVTWTPVSQAADTTTKIGVAAAGAHYYLTEDITYTQSGTNVGFITGPTAQGDVACLHLNGHDLTATKAAAIYSPYARMGTLNVMGNGTVSGNSTAAGTTVYLSSQKDSGRINLYGGTYVKPESNGSSMVALINGGSIHVYDGAWLKGNGSGNAVYMDLAGNAATTFAVHGGKVTGGEVAVAEAAGSKTRKFIVDGRSYVEEMVIRNTNVAVEISGNPVIDRIALKPNGMLTIGTLTKGAKIGVSTNKVFTKSFEKAADYLKYFYAWKEPDSISVTDAGELCYDINYEYYMTPYVRDVKAEAIADGKIHYYFMAAKGMVMSPTNAGDIDKWGDSCLVVFPNGETMLIDSGYAIQAPVISGSLKRMGVSTLDYLVVTHPHNDHAGGAFGSGSTFLDEITVEQVYYQDLQYGGSWDGVLESKCSERNIPYTALWKGDVLTFGEGDRAVTLTMLWPGQEDADTTIEDAANKNSMVFRFDYGEHSSMFTADIYDYTDKKLLAMYAAEELDIDMLKIAHHGLGTNTSSLAFLQVATPEIAVATGSFDINATVSGRFDSVGATLLEDRFHGYIHISSGTDGVMTTETES